LLNDDLWAPLAPRDWLRDLFEDGWFTTERPARFSPPLDVSETEDAYKVTVELPAIDPKQIDLSLENGVLTLRGEKKEEKDEKEGENYHRIERHYGSFSRSLRFPADVDAGKVKADYRSGVLEITVPKTEPAKVIYGMLIAVLTTVIRNFSIFNGGLMFAILIGNMFAPILDYAVRGYKQSKKAAAKP